MIPQGSSELENNIKSIQANVNVECKKKNIIQKKKKKITALNNAICFLLNYKTALKKKNENSYDVIVPKTLTECTHL